MVKRALDQLSRDGSRAALRTIARGLGHARAPDVGALARLVVWGREDAINPLDVAKLDAFGGGRLIVENAGHLPHIENPALVNEALVRFLSKER